MEKHLLIVTGTYYLLFGLLVSTIFADGLK
jgi:hypothetical protein